MEKLYNLKKSLTVVDVYEKLVSNEGYSTVSELATFLNSFCGTYSITGQKINELLEIADFQQQKQNTSNQKYQPLKNAEKLYKIDTITVNNKKVKRLIWKPITIFNALEADLMKESITILRSITNNIYYYELINLKADDIDNKILQENIDLLQKEIKGKEE